MLGLLLTAFVVKLAALVTSIQLGVQYYVRRSNSIRRCTEYSDMHENIWMQPGTRCHMLVYKRGVWQVWTATSSRSGDSDKWCGTYMELHPDGKCVQRTREEVYVNDFVVRPAIGDTE